jgi:hypothetical protein
MKSVIAAVSASILAAVVTSPALASGGCVYYGYNKGSPDVLKFVKWEFGKREGRWLKMALTVHNTRSQSFKWFILDMLVDGQSISLNTRQPVPAASDAVVTAEYEMSNATAAKFQSRAPLICVRRTEDTSGKQETYD